MKYEFHIVDVFTKRPFGGNQLAVLPNAKGIDAATMQKIAREFNFAETTFVLPADNPSNTCRVRIFTPKTELPFAGHPTVGTAAVWAMRNHLAQGETRSLVFEETVGPVSVDVRKEGEGWIATLHLEASIQESATHPMRDQMAKVLSLSTSEVLDCWFASVGLPFCFIHLANAATVDHVSIDMAAWKTTLSNAWSNKVYFFSGDLANGGSLYARMLAPSLGISEDPATGSAAAALVGLAGNRYAAGRDHFALSIAQGVAMGRPSEIKAEARLRAGKVYSVSVTGTTVPVATGAIEVPDVSPS